MKLALVDGRARTTYEIVGNERSLSRRMKRSKIANLSPREPTTRDIELSKVTCTRATHAEMSDGEAVEKENAAPVAAGVEDKAAFLEKWSEGKKDASACRCSHMCLSSLQNLSRNLLDAVAKASVYQTAGKPFGDPKACIAPLSVDLIKYLVEDADGAVPGESKAGVLSDLHHGIATWVESKRSFLNNFSLSSQTDAIDALRLDMSRGEGWKVTDRERVTRELLLRVLPFRLSHGRTGSSSSLRLRSD